MLRLVPLLVMFGLALPARTADKPVTVRFLGGAKKVPLGGLKVTIRAYTGDWTRDHKRTLTDGKTGADGAAGFTLADGWYYVDIAAEKERPYLSIPVGHRGHPALYSRMIRVGAERAFTFTLADACRLTLRAVDAGTGKGIPGVSFSMLSETAESGGTVVGDNLGADARKQANEVTDKDGYLVRFMGPWDGYTYFAWPTLQGYEPVDDLEVQIPTPVGTAKAEHVFRFRKK